MSNQLSLAGPTNKRIAMGVVVTVLFAVSIFGLHQWTNREREIYLADGSLYYRGQVAKVSQEHYETSMYKKAGIVFEGYLPDGVGELYDKNGQRVAKMTFVKGAVNGPAEIYQIRPNCKIVYNNFTTSTKGKGYAEYFSYSEPDFKGTEYVLFKGYTDESGLFDGEGRLYYRQSKQIRYEGIFEHDNFIEGKWFDQNGNLLKEGAMTPPNPGGTARGTETTDLKKGQPDPVNSKETATVTEKSIGDI